MISLVRLQYAFIHYFFFFNDTATTEIYTLSLHDALPISQTDQSASLSKDQAAAAGAISAEETRMPRALKQQEKRSEEHTSELQSRLHLVCRLLLEKKKDHSRQRSHFASRSNSAIT